MNFFQHKRTIYLTIGAIIVGVSGFLAYRYILPDIIVRPKTSGDQGIRGGVAPGETLGAVPLGEPREGATPDGESPQAQEQGLTQITAFSVVGPGLNRAGDRILFYKKEGGDLFSSDFSGKSQEKISNITVVGLIYANRAPQGDRAALFYLDGETKKGFLHIGTSSTGTLPEGITSFSWAPGGASLAYTTKRSALLDLAVANNAGRNQKTIFSTPLLDAQMQWISPSRFSFQTAPSGLAEGFVFLYESGRGSFTRVAGPLFGLMSLWSPDGERALVSHTDLGGEGLQFDVRNSLGAVLFTPPFQTFPEKCAWANASTFYCASPEFIPAAIVLPDGYLRGEFNSTDRLFRVDLTKKDVQEIPLDESLDISSLAIAPREDYLFFVNRADGALWSLRLK